jgi:hypothetical protein
VGLNLALTPCLCAANNLGCMSHGLIHMGFEISRNFWNLLWAHMKRPNISTRSTKETTISQAPVAPHEWKLSTLSNTLLFHKCEATKITNLSQIFLVLHGGFYQAKPPIFKGLGYGRIPRILLYNFIWELPFNSFCWNAYPRCFLRFLNHFWVA